MRFQTFGGGSREIETRKKNVSSSRVVSVETPERELANRSGSSAVLAFEREDTSSNVAPLKGRQSTRFLRKRYEIPLRKLDVSVVSIEASHSRERESRNGSSEELRRISSSLETERRSCSKSAIPRPAGLASPLRNIFARAKTQEKERVASRDMSSLASTSSVSSDRESSISRESEAVAMVQFPKKDTSVETAERPESLVMVVFDANVKEISHGAIIWALQNTLQRGDVLTVLGVLGYVRGPLGYRIMVHDYSALGANKQVVEAEIAVRKQLLLRIPGLAYRCQEAGVKLVVDIKTGNKPEVVVVNEATALNARHVVLDKNMKNKKRRYYLENLACDVTRMRRDGGVDTIRSLSSICTEHNCLGNAKPLHAPPSPRSVIPSPLRYRHQTDVFKISLRPTKPSSESVAFTRSITSQIPSSFTSSSRDSKRAEEELFSINHGLLHRMEERERDLLAGRNDCNASGYDSDDLFSITHESARESFALSGPLDAQSVIAAFRKSVSSDLMSNSRRFIDVDRHDPYSSAVNDKRLSVDVSSSSARRLSNGDRDSECDSSIWEQLSEATITGMTFVVGLGDAVEVNLSCNALQPGEGLLVGSSPSALFLVHAENYQRGISYRVSAGTPNMYVAMEGTIAMKLSDLTTNQRVMVVDAHGKSRAVLVGHTATEAKPLVLLEAEVGNLRFTIMVHHTESVCLIAQGGEAGEAVSVNNLKVGDRVMLSVRTS